MSQKKDWFWYSGKHEKHLKELAQLLAGEHDRPDKCFCQLDTGEVLPYTVATRVGGRCDDLPFDDYEFLGEGVFHHSESYLYECEDALNCVKCEYWADQTGEDEGPGDFLNESDIAANQSSTDRFMEEWTEEESQ